MTDASSMVPSVRMNGYRDPITDAQERELVRAEAEELGIDLNDLTEEGEPGERECGFRKEGGVYAEVPRDAYGKPIEYFIGCPPIPIDRTEYNLTNVGVRLIEVPAVCLHCKGRGKATFPVITEVSVPLYAFPVEEGAEKPPMIGEIGFDLRELDCPECGGSGKVPVWHVFDIIGQESYPNVADWIEEARRLGVSRRLELNAEEYGKLTPRSRLFLLHARAVIRNPEDYYKGMNTLEVMRLKRAGCTKSLPLHSFAQDKVLTVSRKEGEPIFNFPATPTGCSSLYWHDLDPEATPARKDVFTSCSFCAGTGESFWYGDVETPLDRGLTAPVVPEGAKIAPCSKCGGSGDAPDSPRFVERTLASGTYRAYLRPDKVRPDYGLGIFAIFPLFRIVLVDPNGEHDKRAADISAAKVETDVVDC